jgi:hypothetical protein
MRAMIAIAVLLVIRTPSLIGFPERMLAKSSSCSCWYMSFFGASLCQTSPFTTVCCVFWKPLTVAVPVVPTM